MDTLSNKNKPMPSCGGYLMRKADKNGDGTLQFWRCAKKGCNGRAQSAFGSTSNLVERKPHISAICVPSPTATVIKERMGVVKRIAKDNPALSSQSILVTSKLDLTDLQAELFPEDVNIKKRITNARRPLEAAEANSEPMVLVLSNEFKTTLRGGVFLIFDSRVTQPGKPVILIFSSEYGLHLLEQRKKWSGDGTFFSCPKYFKQLYSINVFEGESSLPAAFFLLPGKSEEIYKRSFDGIFAGHPMLVPDSFMSDFELAPSNILKQRFPLMVVNFCIFHFGQSLFKKFKNKGLMSLYQNPEVKCLLRSLNALPFLPSEEVGLGFDEVCAELQIKMDQGIVEARFHGPLDDYLKYIGCTYVRRFDVNNFEVPPLFPIALWNCNQSVRNNVPRTNNAIEGWHYQFNKRFPKSSMPFSYFIVQRKEEEHLTRQLDGRHEANPADAIRNARKKAVIKADNQIKGIVDRYSEVDQMHRNRLQFLRRVQIHLAKTHIVVPEDVEPVAVVDTIDEEVDGNILMHE